MTNTNERIQALNERIMQEVMGIKNFDSLNLDEAALKYSQKDLLSYTEVDNMVGLSSYNVRVHYVPVVGIAPVQFELFGTNWNTGVIVGQTLVFTNAAGDQAVVTGITAPITVFQDRLRTASFKVAYVRERVANAAQFNNQVTLQQDTVFGAFNGNRLDPNEYITPEQFQLLRCDIPLNTSFDSQRRFICSVGPTETLAAGGSNFTFFVNAVQTPIKTLAGGPGAMQLKGDGILGTSPSISTDAKIDQLVSLQNTQAKLITNFMTKIKQV